MLIKGSMVTEMSGSLGGITAARNKGGLYLRARSGTVNPNSPAQQAVRAAFTELVDRWNENLDQVTRDAWETYATNVTVTNPLGDAKQNSGQNWYVALNTPRIIAGLIVQSTPPSIFGQAQLNPVSITVDATGAPADLTVNFDDNQDWTEEDSSALIVQAGFPQNPGINFFKGPFRFAGAVTGDSVIPGVPSPQTVTNPLIPQPGQRVFARIRLSREDGRLSAPQIVSTIAT